MVRVKMELIGRVNILIIFLTRLFCMGNNKFNFKCKERIFRKK